MMIERRTFLRGGLLGLALASNRGLLGGLSVEGAQYDASGPLYPYDLLKWLYIGWENDHPKSWTFMGGGVSPGLGDLIQYTVTVDGATSAPDEFALDRKSRIK